MYDFLLTPEEQELKKEVRGQEVDVQEWPEVLTREEREELSRLLKKVGRHAEKIRPD